MHEVKSPNYNDELVASNFTTKVFNSMQINLVSFGIAKDIIGAQTQSVELNQGKSLKDLKAKLVSDYPRFSDLASLRFAVNEEYQDDEYELSNGEEVVIIPPVSGG